MNIKQTTVLFLLISSWCAGFSQPVAGQWIAFQEKIFVHPDRNLYLSGEQIWFTVYCTETITGSPSRLSQLATLELFDPDGRAMARQKVRLVNGVGAGVLRIPAECASGPYLMRTCTSWQRNDGPWAYCYTPLVIIDPAMPLKQKGNSGQVVPEQTFSPPFRDPSDSPDRGYHVRFYPEGGTLVAGVENHVVFTVTDGKGKPVGFQGVLSGSGRGITGDAPDSREVRTLHPGIGSFRLNPRAGIRYRVTPLAVDQTGGDTLPETGTGTREILLPESLESGCALEVVQDGNGAVRVILRFGQNREEKVPEVAVLLRNRRCELIRKQFPASGVKVLEFTGSETAEGPNQVVVYESRGTLLAVRNFRVGSPGAVAVSMANLRDRYAPRDTVSVDLQLSLAEGEPDRAIMSVSVARAGTGLAGNLAGSPVWNLEPGAIVPELAGMELPPGIPEVTDLLRIAGSGQQGIFPSRELRVIRHLPETEGQVVAGTVTHRSTGVPLPGRRLLIAFPESAPSLYAAVTDSLGRYFIAAGFRQNGTEGMVRLMEPDQEAMILPEDEFPDDALPELDLIPPMEGMEALFRELLVVQQVNSTYGISHDTAWINEDRPPALFGSYDQVIVMEDYISLPVMEEVFRELGKSVLLIRNGDGYHVRLVDRQTNRVIGDSPLYLLDGVPFTDPGILLQLDPSQLKEIRFKCSRYFLQDLVMDGIIDIRSLSGDYLPPELSGSLVRFPCRGLPAEKHAFRPDKRALEEDHIPLVMNTLYVNPHYTYRGGETNALQWIAPDSKGRYDIVVRVVDADGHAGEAIRSFRVE